MSWINNFIKDNIKKILHIWIFIIYLVNEELKYYHPILSILLSIFSIFIFHYISLLETQLSETKIAIHSQPETKPEEVQTKTEEVDTKSD